MIRRFPVLVCVAGLATVVAIYAATADRLVAAADQSWYQLVERRLVQDRTRLVPPAGTRWFGMYRPELPWDYARFYTIGRQMGVEPRIVAWYQAWGEGGEHQFKADAVDQATAKGLIPLITWEPWLSAFGRQRITDPLSSLGHIIDGKYDAYIRQWAQAVVRARRPVFLRPLHEMGNPAYFWSTTHGNTPVMQAECWRHIVRIFRDEGAHNAAFIWTPYTAADLPSWPGGQWVDWVGLDIFNYGTLAEGGSWMDFRTLLHAQVSFVRHLGKPIILSEVGCSGFGGNRLDWWSDAFRELGQGALPEVKAVVIYDNPAYTSDASRLTVDWGFTHTPDLPNLLRPLAPRAGFSTP